MKNLFLWHLCLVSLLSTGSLSFAQNQPPELQEDEQLIEFTTTRFTLPNIHFAPDKKHIIFNVLGDIYQVSIKGGRAKALLQDNYWKYGAKLSPDSKTLAFTSDETGESQIWTYNIETKEKKVYPPIEHKHYPLYAYWSLAGELLIPSIEGLRSFDIETGEGKIIRPAKEEERSIMHSVNLKMVVNPRDNFAFFQSKNALWNYDFNTHKDNYLGAFDKLSKNSFIHISPDNKTCLYYRQAVDNNDVKNNMELIKWDLGTNVKEILFKAAGVGYTTKLNFDFDFIDNNHIVLNRKGQIVIMNINTGSYYPIPIIVNIKKVIRKPLHREPQYIRDSVITASVLRNPVTRPDLDTIYFGAFGKLHSYSKATKKIRELFPGKDRFETSPALSPDGKYLAYTTWNDWKMGHLYVRVLNTGKEFKITQNPGKYINPTWSSNGKEIVFLADETVAKMGIGFQKIASPYYNIDVRLIQVFEGENVLTNTKSRLVKRIAPSVYETQRHYPVPILGENKNIFVDAINKEKGLPSILEIDSNNSNVIAEKIIPFNTEEAIVSPDNKHIAFIYDKQIWLDSFPHTTALKFSSDSKFIKTTKRHQNGYITKILLPKAKSIFQIAPSYLSWQDNNTLIWNSAEEIYKHDITTEKTTKIADIKVQKKRAIPKTQYALTNIRIITIDKRDRIIEKGTILIKNNRIEEVGSLEEIVVPKDYKVFDLNGKTIIPGLIDVHAHYHRGPHELMSQQSYEYVGNLAYGVTAIYDPSVNVLDYKERSQMIETGLLLGPRIFASGDIIMNYPRSRKYHTLESEQDSDRVLLSYKKLGVHGPIKEYSILNRKKRNLLYHSSKRYKYSITSHQGNFEKSISRIMQGYTAIEHEVGSFPLQKDVTELIGKSKVAYTPTYMVSPGIANIYVDSTSSERLKLLRFNGKYLYHNNYAYTYEYQNKKRQKTIDHWSISLKNQYNRAITSLKDILNAGGNISVGGHGNPLPGISTHWELWFMTKGMSNYQALQAATINGAKKIDLQKEIGSIEKGKLADLVILNSNPLDNIFNTTDILYTVQNGNIYKADSMKQIYPSKKELKPWGWDSPIVLKSIESLKKIYRQN